MPMKDDEDDLGPWFAAGRTTAPPVPGALLARVLADAAAEEARRRPVRQGQTPREGGWRRLLSGLGGWMGVSGLATAAVGGLWIGLALPDAVSRALPGLTAEAETDLLASADTLFDEE